MFDEYDETMRKLPVYLVLDCSGSMMGAPIESVRQGVTDLLTALRGDPQALETVWLSVITFDSKANQIVPLTPIDKFQPPSLDAGGTTSLGQALDVLTNAIATEVKTSSPTQKGDWKPLVFLMTDGVPTDPWEQQADNFKVRPPGKMIAVGVGSQVKEATLKRLSDDSFLMKDATPDDFAAFFKWVSGSILTQSQKAPEPDLDPSEEEGEASSTLPPPPPEIQLIP